MDQWAFLPDVISMTVLWPGVLAWAAKPGEVRKSRCCLSPFLRVWILMYSCSPRSQTHSTAKPKHLPVLLSPALLTLSPSKPEMPCPRWIWQDRKVAGLRPGYTDPTSGALTLACGPPRSCVRLWTRGLMCVTCSVLCAKVSEWCFLEYEVLTGFVLEFWKQTSCQKHIKTKIS